VSDDPRKADGIDVHCFAGCSWQDVKAELEKCGLLQEFKPSAPKYRHSAAWLKPASANGDADAEQRIDLAIQIWDASMPLVSMTRTTRGHRYLTEHRGLDIDSLGDLSEAIRFHEGFNAVVSLMTDALTNEPVGVHRIFLNEDATKLDKKMLGRQGVVRLSPDESVTYGIGITEGVEDALAILVSGWSPVWAATSAGAIKSFPVLPVVDALTIFKDDDTAGNDAAETCARRWYDAGREVFIASPGEQLQ
jgi:hypothetical protein